MVNYGLILTNSSVFFSGGLSNHGLLLDPAADADGDGMNNLDEALAGTNPTNPASLFRATSRHHHRQQRAGHVDDRWRA